MFRLTFTSPMEISLILSILGSVYVILKGKTQLLCVYKCAVIYSACVLLLLYFFFIIYVKTI